MVKKLQICMFGWPLLVALLVTMPLVLFTASGIARAAGDAAFSLSPASGTYAVGATLTLTLSEMSASGDSTNAVQTNLSYTPNLTYQSTSLAGPFTLCGQNSGGGGSVNLGCAATTAQAGSHSVARIIFKVAAASGSAVVKLTSGSDIDNTSGGSVWNGALPSASFNLTNASVPAKSAFAAPSAVATAPAKTAPSVSTAPKLPRSSLTVVVTDSHGRPLEGARVSLDNHYATYTNKQGKAGFSAIASGRHSVHVTDKGKKPAQKTITLTPNQTRQVVLQLNSTASDAIKPTMIIGAVVVVLALGGYGCFKLFRRQPPDQPVAVDSQSTPPPTVIGPAT